MLGGYILTIESFDIVYYTCIFLLPGFLIKSFKDLLVPAERHNEMKYFSSCLLYSIINCAVWSWAYKLIYPISAIRPALYWIIMLAITIVGAAFISIVIAMIVQKNWIPSILNKIKVRSIHTTPTAWDYFFSKQEPAWIIVSLKSGQRFYGLYDSKSFAASDSEYRDIYIEKTYILDENKNWVESERSKGVLISKEDIETIEFYT